MIAPIAMSVASCPPPPSSATIGITDSGSAVPTAASSAPTAPAPRFMRCPSHSTAFVKPIAPPMMSTKAASSSSAVVIASRAPRIPGTGSPMEVLVAGGHGQIALRLLKLLAEHGHRGRGLIRNPDHAADLEAVGAEAVLCDLETDDPHQHVGSAQAIVFAAGAGPGSGAERKRTVDLGGAVKLIDAARELGVARYVMVSAMGTQDVEHAAEAMRPYLQAKKDADDALMASGLDWTIVRPGRLTDAPGAGTVDAARALGRRGEITRDDTALVLLETLVRPSLARVAFDVLEGPTPVADALDASVAPAKHRVEYRRGAAAFSE